MHRHFSFKHLAVILACLSAAVLLAIPLLDGASAQRATGGGGRGEEPRMSETARRQIEELLAEKRSRTPAQRKLSSQLVYAEKEMNRQPVTSSVESLRAEVKADDSSRVLVDVRGTLTEELSGRIRELGGEVVYHTPLAPKFRAHLPLDGLEEIAAWSEVKFIRPASQPHSNTRLQRERRAPGQVAAEAGKRAGARASFAERLSRVKSLIERVLPKAEGATEGASDAGAANPFAVVSHGPPFFTQGDITHRARESRPFFGATGRGVKVGVISTSTLFLEDSIALGSLPPDVTVLAGESGTDIDPSFNTGEGTAMLEIVHALAPDAKLFYATGIRSPESFADNIRALRRAGCDVIVDDITWSDEPPFQDGVIARAVNEVTRDGALYFSAAGNGGNFNDGTSKVWEGDYKDGGELGALPGGRVHDFSDGAIANRVRQNAATLSLFWADPQGESGNDYDLFVLNANFTRVVAASTDFQDGDDDPLEVIFANFSRPAAFTNERVVVLNYGDSAPRALRLDTFFSAELGLGTPGQIYGHAGAADAFAVAAVDAETVTSGFGFGSPFFIGGPTNPVEFFSSDGPRRVFYNEDGTPLTPGNFLFSTNGGTERQKPDIAAADGVLTSSAGFIPFFGTSAAAPHAAAIAALLKSAVPNITPGQARQALQSSALDIRAEGVDRDSGSGIVMAFNALEAAGANASPAPLLKLARFEIRGGDGTGFVDPGEGGALNVQLVNVGAAAATNVKATLTSSTPGVTVTNAASGFPPIGAPGNASNSTPFAFALAGGLPCGEIIKLTLAVTADGLPAPETFDLTVQSGRPGSPVIVTYTGARRPIPDNDADGVNVPLNITQFSGRLWDVNFRVNGTVCSTAAGATTVGLDHSFVGDLTLTLVSPSGTRVPLMNRPGGIFNGGRNFCGTLLDDESHAPWVQTIFPSGPQPLGAPYAGTLKPTLPLAAFKGEGGNGVWVLNVRDNFSGDVGGVRSFSLVLTPAACKE